MRRKKCIFGELCFMMRRQDKNEQVLINEVLIVEEFDVVVAWSCGAKGTIEEVFTFPGRLGGRASPDHRSRNSE